MAINPEKYALALVEALFTDKKLLILLLCDEKEQKSYFKKHIVTLLHYISLTWDKWLSSFQKENKGCTHRVSI